MGRIIGRTPYAVVVQNDDGSARAMPPGFAPPEDLMPAAMPTPDVAPADDAPMVPTPDESPVPDTAIASLGPLPGDAPPSIAPRAPVSLLPMPGEMGGAPIAPDAATDAVTGAGQIVPPAPMPATDAGPPVGAPPADVAPPEMSPEDAATDAVRQQAAHAAKLAEEQAAMLRERDAKLADMEAQRLEADARVADHRAKAQAQVDSAVNAFADNDLTPAEKTSGVGAIALLFGGIGNVLMGQGGAANPVIAILERKADAAARARAAKQAKLGQIVGLRRDAVDSINALAKDEQSYILAAKAGILEHYARQVETTAAGYQGGAELAKGEQAAAQIRAAAAAARAEAADKEHKRQIEDAKLQLDAAAQQTARFNAETSRKQIGVAYANIALDREKLEEQSRQFFQGRDDTQRQREFDNALALDKLDIEIGKAQAEGRSKDVSVLREEREAKAQQAALSVGAFPKTKTDDKGNPIGAEWQELTQADGTVYRAPSAKRAEDLAAKGSAVTKSVALLDRLMRARDQHGWSSDLMKSDDWREMRADYGQLILVAKDAAGLGALAGPDVAILNQAFGTADPTEVRDPGAGLAAARRNMVNGFNADLRANNYTGEAFDIPDVVTNAGLKKAAATTPEAQLVEDVIAESRSGKTIKLGDAAPQARYVSEKLAPLATLATSGNAGAQAALARLTRDRVLGTDAIVYIVANNIDLGPYASPDDLAEFRKVYDKTPRAVLGNVPGYEVPTLGGAKPAKPAPKVGDLKVFGGAP